jgi:hypothetical protein
VTITVTKDQGAKKCKTPPLVLTKSWIWTSEGGDLGRLSSEGCPGLSDKDMLWVPVDNNCFLLFLGPLIHVLPSTPSSKIRAFSRHLYRVVGCMPPGS